LAFCLAASLISSAAGGKPRPPESLLSAGSGSTVAWLGALVGQRARFGLDEAELSLLDGVLYPWRTRAPDWAPLWRALEPELGSAPQLAWNDKSCEQHSPPPTSASQRIDYLDDYLDAPWPNLALGSSDFHGLGLSSFELVTEEARLLPLEAFAHPLKPARLRVVREASCPAWKTPKPATLIRVGKAGEFERLSLLDCRGATTADALDRVSVLARAPDAARPELPLPIEPEATSVAGEWVSGVRLIHPRLVWVLAKIAQAFPGRALRLYSAYRPSGHTSLHRLGRAVDLAVDGVGNERLHAFCRSLRFIGCGYYPNNQFVHLDLRPHGSPEVTWVDAAAPGEPSRYLTSDASPDAPGPT
jgi:hypothetical protein